MFAKGRSLCICSTGPLKMMRKYAVPLISIYCGCFGLCVSLLTLQFVYRYIALCKTNKLFWFNGERMALTFLPSIIIFVVWTALVYFPMLPNKLKEDHFNDVLREVFNMDSYKVAFLAVMYKSPSTVFQEGKWDPIQILACSLLCVIMAVCFSTIILCGLKAWLHMQNSVAFMSLKTRDLNRQLFVTLGIQTLLPTITMYVPVGLVIILPMFGVELGVTANKVSAFVGLYPALDPLIALFLIKDFRKVLLCKHRSRFFSIQTSTVITRSRNLESRF